MQSCDQCNQAALQSTGWHNLPAPQLVKGYQAQSAVITVSDDKAELWPGYSPQAVMPCPALHSCRNTAVTKSSVDGATHQQLGGSTIARDLWCIYHGQINTLATCFQPSARTSQVIVQAGCAQAQRKPNTKPWYASTPVSTHRHIPNLAHSTPIQDAGSSRTKRGAWPGLV